jgi:SAM-dependent methyltransferase
MDGIDSELQYESPLDPAVGERHRWLAGLLAARPGELVADLGCGDGVTLDVLAGQVGDGLVVGLDTAEAALRLAAGRLGVGRGGRVALARADLRGRLPLRDGSLDGALCHNVLESLPDPDAFLREVHRVLRPGGRLVLSHPDYDTMVFTAPDLALTRRLVHAYCDTQQDWMSAVNGAIGRWLHSIAADSPLQAEPMTATTVVSRGWRPPMLGYLFAQHVAAVLGRTGTVPVAELNRWLASLETIGQRGEFLWTVVDFTVVCHKR